MHSFIHAFKAPSQCYRQLLNYASAIIIIIIIQRQLVRRRNMAWVTTRALINVKTTLLDGRTAVSRSLTVYGHDITLHTVILSNNTLQYRKLCRICPVRIPSSQETADFPMPALTAQHRKWLATFILNWDHLLAVWFWLKFILFIVVSTTALNWGMGMRHHKPFPQSSSCLIIVPNLVAVQQMIQTCTAQNKQTADEI